MTETDRERRQRSERVRSPKTSELIARELTGHIVQARLPEGTTLANEREMADQLNVGRATLREALRLLESRGVITVRAGRNGGPVVRRPRPGDLSKALTLIMRFEDASLSDVLEARIALEPVTARLAATRIGHDHLATLQRTIDAMREHADDQRRFLDENALFHSVVAEASGSIVLRIFVDSLKLIADGAVVGVEYPRRRRLKVANAHQRIVDALGEGREAEAEAAMRGHVLEAGRYWTREYASLVNRNLQWT